ncbi:beta-ketoacyl-[acyl-carrier-protein] synthase family protein [Candidatus Albibeggiatoa sp. nov. NOAA]|uniref:beta-ketoacyl-[acyl-carrier-protein] synthase family protein n=1 Tax=Candidatus Albibeggiatoa sp. nov. NOAA TaxID=3162724 RepID=UPI003303858E|nr:beta-ketoacyl-[acyl-carrier-protein] synthase family protein [Thiotrichaceae bacterium]
MSPKRIAVTGMSINTPLGDTVDEVGHNMLLGKSAITQWKGLDTSEIYSKIGGDLSFYDVDAKLKYFENKIPESVFAKTKHIFKQITRNTKLSILMSLDAYLDAGLFQEKLDPYETGVICGGHNLTSYYLMEQYDIFREEPDFIDGLSGLNTLDTDYSSSIAEVLNMKGMAYLVGGTCATGNLALQTAMNAISYDDKKVISVACPMVSFNPLMLQSLTVLEAISYDKFNDTPEKASRPYDVDREGFLPCEGGATLILEDLEHAKARGATIYAELLGVSVNSDANHLGNPSKDGQVHVITTALKKANIAPQAVDYLSAHATSTHLGDIVEIQSIKQAFGDHAYQLLINAPKSLLGHTMWAAGAVEAVLAIWQMNKGEFHRSHNIEQLEPQVDLNVCAESNVKQDVNIFVNNSFGMGGINSASVFQRYDG